jgi:hypothetical protein
MRNETLERLAAADPLPDGERLTVDEAREAEQLLARVLATPVEAAPRRRPRRWAVAAAGVAGVTVAAFAAANLIESDSSGPGVVDKAVAAVTREDAVYHVVERMRATMPPGMGPNMTTYLESWHTTDGRVHQRRFELRGGRPGPLLSDFAGARRTGGRDGGGLAWTRANTIVEVGLAFVAGPVPRITPFEDPGAQLRALEEQGKLRLAGTEDFDGHRAYRLESGPITRPGRPGGQARIVFLVDAETYLPLAMRETLEHPSGRRWSIETRYLVYEHLPLNDRTRRLLALDPHPGARCSPTARDVRGLGFANPCARP